MKRIVALALFSLLLLLPACTEATPNRSEREHVTATINGIFESYQRSVGDTVARYKDKIVVVSGNFEFMFDSNSPTGETIVVVSEANSDVTLMAYVAPENTEYLDTIKQRELVAVSGIFLNATPAATLASKYVHFEDCIIIKASDVVQ